MKTGKLWYVTIYVEMSGGCWEARYWHSDERRYYRFRNYSKDAAILECIAHTGYRVDQCRVLAV